MQLEDSGREGADDSTVNQTSSGDCGHGGSNQENDNLEKYFIKHGLSVNAYNKMSYDVNNGDLNVLMLISCNENELNQIADGYKLTWLQKRAFVNAAKLLKKSTNKQKQY